MRKPVTKSLASLLNADDNPYKILACAVVLMAVGDYRSALQSGDEKERASLERFFNSSWYRALTTLDADMVMNRVRQECENEMFAVSR